MHQTYVALTDYDWYSQLLRMPECDRVNFWTPTPWNVKFQDGDKGYFLLKQKYGRKICGYGEFEEYENLSIEEAWQKYGKANGVNGLTELESRTRMYMEKNSKMVHCGKGHIIGCICLKNTVFLQDKNQFPPAEKGWDIAGPVMKYKKV